MRMTWGIRWRIVLTYFVLVVLTLSIFGVYMMQFIEKLYMDRLKDQLREETSLLAAWSAAHLDSSNPENLEVVSQMLRRTAHEIGGRITLFDMEGRVLADTLEDEETHRVQKEEPEVSAAISGGVGLSIRKTNYSTYNVLHLAVPLFRPDSGTQIAVVRTGVPLQEAHDTLQSLWGRIGLSLVVVAVLGALFGLRFAHGIATPIEAITAATRKIAAGAFDERIHQRGQGELGVMADSINLMAARISEQIEDLTQQKGKLEGVLTHLVSGVLVVDRSGRITLVNRAAEKIIGMASEQLLHKWHWEAGHNFGLSSLIDEAILVGTEQKREVTLFLPIERTVEVYISPVMSNNGKIAGAVVLMHDVSDWRRLERMRSEFVANVSHELRTPITAVKGFSETLLDGAMHDPDITKQFLQIIHDEADRLTRLVTDLLELSKIESGHAPFRFAKTDLVKLAERTVARYTHQAEQAGLTLRAELPQEPVEGLVDGDRIAQVLINLVGNAIAYTPAGGEVVVAVEGSLDGAVLEVRDTGIGIPSEDLPRLFERFYRVDKARDRRSGGTGLGLAIVKHIVEGHGGRVQVNSTVGKGSTFRVFLPKTPPQGLE
jgi:two-component system phosphate regulon sensor histidine kinase PhoR